MTTAQPTEQPEERTNDELVAGGSNQDQAADLAPLRIIRTETVLSRLPIHNLAKKGSIHIRIVRKKDDGELELLWVVSPSRDHGEPRQLAYKLDTVVINRHINEEGRPLPEIIRLGSLREVCKDLGLRVSGRAAEQIKRALLQNAFAGITVKLNYKGIDGQEHRLEAGFTRYTVIFTGQRLSNGKKADGVYIELHPRYREVLNNAPVRPLNYDYLKQLPPAAQRFYEILSYRIFAALKFRQAEAKLPYSEYCTFSAQQRYYEFWKVKRQMTPIHRRHLQSRYLKAVRYEHTTDSDHRPDWIMCYVPGPKARAEFTAFTRKSQLVGATPQPAVTEGIGETRPPTARVPALPGAAAAAKPQPADQLPLTLTLDPVELVRYFHHRARHVEDHRPTAKEIHLAEELLKQHDPDKANFVVEFAIRSARRTNFEMRTFGAVRQYVAEALEEYERIRRQEEHIRQLQAQEEDKERAEEEERRRVEQRLAGLPPEEYQALCDKIKAELLDAFPSWKHGDWDSPLRQGILRASLIREFQRRELQSQPKAGNQPASPAQG